MNVTVVTGGGSGIGQATALALLARGEAVVIADLNEASGAQTIELAASDRIHFVRADASAEADVANAVRVAEERFGPLTGFVANAGIGGAFGPITEVEVDDWDYTFAVLTRGPFLAIKHAARAFQAHGTHGAVVSIASVAAFNGGSGPQAYSSAKAAVANLTRSAAVELAAHRIRVNAVAPGVIHTPLFESGRATHAQERLATAQPWPDRGRAEHVADAVCFLLSEQATFITGETLVVDGGLTAAGPGTDFIGALGLDPRVRGLSGVSRGTTGERSTVRKGR